MLGLKLIHVSKRHYSYITNPMELRESCNNTHVHGSFRHRNMFVAILHQGPLLVTWFNFIPSKENNHMPSEVWDEITFPFPNFKWFHSTFLNGYNYLSILELKLIHVSKRVPRRHNASVIIFKNRWISPLVARAEYTRKSKSVPWKLIFLGHIFSQSVTTALAT